MASLSSLIVQRQVASIVDVEQAIARQVIHGGDLVTNLLEVAPQCEHALTRVLSENLGFPSMPPGRLPAPTSDVLDLVSVEVALRSGIFPLRLAGRSLVVATSERLPPSVEHDLAYSLGLDITPVAAPLIRIREGIAAHYGVPLEPRQLRLVQKLDGIESPRAATRASLLDVAELPPSNLRSGVSSPPAARSQTPVMRHSGQLPAVTPRADDRATDPGAPPPIVSEPPAPLPSIEPEAPHTDRDVQPEAVEAAPATEAEPPVATSRSSVPPRSSSPAASSEPPPPMPPEPPTPPVEPPPPLDDSPRPPTRVDKRALARLLQREVADKKRTARTARRKGPFSRVDAERELENAKTPDDVLDAFFGFGSQFFEYAALFVVHGDVAEGRDAWGPGADHLRVIGLGVPLDLPSALSRARKEGRVLITRLDDEDLDRELRKDLGRARPKPCLAAIIPLTVKNRSVAVLVGDDGEADVSLSGLGDLVGFSALASAQLERLALLKKGTKPPFAGLVTPRQASNVAVLARIFPTKAASQPPPAVVREVPAPAREVSAPVREPTFVTAKTDYPPPAVVETPEAGAPPPEPALPPRSAPPAPATTPGTGPPPRSRMPSVLLRTDTPTDGTPSLESGVSPGARSVHPPAQKPETTRPYGDRILEPLPGLHDGVRGNDETVLADQVLGKSSPPRVVVRDSAAPSRQSFAKPIPREDESDASSVVAEASASSWVPESGTLRENDIGTTYQLVPRPAEARVRGDEPADLARLLERALMGGLEGEEAMSELIRIADQAFPKLVERFPGPLSVDRFKAREAIAPASECGPLLKLLVVSRRASLPFMTVRSASPDVEQRFWATHVLGELLFAESSNAVLPRLFDDDVSVRRVARRAAQALVSAGAPGEPIKTSLEHTLKNQDEPMHRRLLAIEALADVRVPTVVPVLVSGLSDPSEAILEAARTALIVVTRQDLGRSPDVWMAWWAGHQSEHRIEWLIRALTHESSSIRRAAGDELKLVTREYFGYYDDLPPRERERAQERYATWWREEGRYRFR